MKSISRYVKCSGVAAALALAVGVAEAATPVSGKLASSITPPNTVYTPYQIAAEHLYARILKSPEVQRQLAVVKKQWIDNNQKNFALMGGVDATNLAQLDTALTGFAVAMAQMGGIDGDPTNPAVIHVEAPPHRWKGVDIPDARWGYDNQDNIYYNIPVDSNSSYLIRGKFLGQVPTDFGINALQEFKKTVGYLGIDDLKVESDGTFSITVSSAPAKPGQVNHIQLPAGVDGVLSLGVRNTLGDWVNEGPAGLTIERVGGPPANPPRTFEQQVKGTVDFMKMVEPFYLRAQSWTTIDPFTGKPTPPNTFRQPVTVPGSLTVQTQSWGNFNIEDNQALVITIDPADAKYFVVPVTNQWSITNNYWDYQTSLNNLQSVANPDGTYTFVVSKKDPGVANWIDTGGLNRGGIQIRFQRKTKTGSVSTQVVTLDQLSTVLPKTTKYFTPEERHAQIAARQQGYKNRYLTYSTPR